MKRLLFPAVVCAAVGLAALAILAQNPPAQGQSAQGQAAQPKPSADPYINNKDAGKTQFPLAAPAGNAIGYPPACHTPRLTSYARSRRCR